MTPKIRVVAVSYLNTKPLTYAFERGAMSDQMELEFEYPSKLADRMIGKQADLGLIPVAMIPSLQEAQVVSDFCIGAVSEVASVCLFSACCIEEVETVLLDYQSRTSVALLKILLKHHWKINPQLVLAEPGYENQIAGKTAALIIGDRALQKRNAGLNIYDLASAWIDMTGLPFVFAAWVSNRVLPESFLQDFNDCLEESLSHMDELSHHIEFPDYDLHTYYHQNISYWLDEDKINGMNLFLDYLRKENL